MCVSLLFAFTCAVAAAPTSSAAQPSITWFPDHSNVPPLTWPPPPPYNHTVKELPAAPSADQCRQACAGYTNSEVSPVSGWSKCQSFTWLPDGRCVAIVDSDEWQLSPMKGATTGKLTWPSANCHSDADCSHNGVCSADAQCECIAAWRGDRCQTLALLPTRRQWGLRARDGGINTSTWGGAVLRDHDTGLYHMWASELLSHCGIESWTTNSHVVHATSTNGQ